MSLSIYVSISDEAKATLDRVAREVGLPAEKTASDLLEGQLKAEREHYQVLDRQQRSTG
jgi:hypothetical protein